MHGAASPPGARHPRLTRAEVIRAAAAATAAVGTGALAAACSAPGSAGRGSARPSPAAPAVEVVFQPNVQFIPWNATTQALFQQFVDSRFNADPRNRGIRATVFPGGQSNAQGQIVATLAGKGYADIFLQFQSSPSLMEQAGVLQPLDDLMRRDNISTSLWSTELLQAVTAGGSLYGLPAYDATHCVFYRQDLLDDLGLAYPDPSWSYQDAAQIWTQAAGKNRDGSARAGMSFYWGSSWLPWQLRGWGAAYASADRTRATMGSAQGAAALSFFVDLLHSGVAIAGNQTTTLLPSAAAVFAEYHSAHLVDVGARILGGGYKWNILPMPLWPAGRSAATGNTSYLLNRYSRNQEAAWTVMKWLTGAEGSQDWAKFQIQVSLVTPGLISLWDYWQTAVVAVAPPLKGKQLQWFADPERNNYEHPEVFFRYQAVQADTLVQTWLGAITAGHVSVQEGLQQMQAQINALQQIGAREEQSQQQAAGQFPTQGADMAAVAAGV